MSHPLQEAEFDERIAKLMQHARAIRDNISVTSRRTSRGTSAGGRDSGELDCARVSSNL